MTHGNYLLWAQLLVLVLQLALLAVNACLVRRYVLSTDDIKTAALRQAALTGDQVEAMSRPVLVPRLVGEHLKLANVGIGPALRVEWWVVSESEPFTAPAELAPHSQVGLLQAGAECTMMLELLQLQPLGNRRKTICRCRSISGRAYLTQTVTRSDSTDGWWLDSEIGEETRRPEPK